MSLERAGDVISALVIGKVAGHSALLTAALRESHGASEPGYRLLVHQANSFGELREQAPSVRVDFVAIAMDLGEPATLEWLSMILSELPPRLFLRKVILINAKGLAVYSIAVNRDALLEIAKDYKVDIMSADVTISKQCRFLANRIITYMEESVGCHSGIPQIYSCTHKAD